MQRMPLGLVPVGELLIWHNRVFGEVLAQVKEHFAERTLVLADNNITYEWPNDMIVEVDD